MKTVYKYRVTSRKEQILEVPRFEGMSFKEQFLQFDYQDGWPMMWCMVDTDAEVRKVKIAVVGTGNDLQDYQKKDFLGTYIFYGFVCHALLAEEER